MPILQNPDTLDGVWPAEIIIITGSRAISRKTALFAGLVEIGFPDGIYDDTLLVWGGAGSGIDDLVRKYIHDRNHKLYKEFPYLSKYGKVGGLLRNRQMCEWAYNARHVYPSNPRLVCLAVWDGLSSGTANCAANAVSLGIETVVYIPHEYKRPYPTPPV